MLTFLDRPAELWMAVGSAAAVAGAAWRVGSLSRGGAVAAMALGTVALLTAWGWGTFLIVWFVSASVLSHAGRARKAERVRGIVEKGDRRDGWQVLANGIVFAAAATAVTMWPNARPLLAPGAAAALAAAGADTWATEIGTLLGGPPWSLRLRATVPPGTSGAVTWAGSLAVIAGSVTLALMAWWANMITLQQLPAVTAGGVAGAWADTIIGAWCQARRWCPHCRHETEQETHECGTRTIPCGGIRRLDNDAVNLFCTIVGASTAICLSR